MRRMYSKTELKDVVLQYATALYKHKLIHKEGNETTFSCVFISTHPSEMKQMILSGFLALVDSTSVRNVSFYDANAHGEGENTFVLHNWWGYLAGGNCKIYGVNSSNQLNDGTYYNYQASKTLQTLFGEIEETIEKM